MYSALLSFYTLLHYDEADTEIVFENIAKSWPSSLQEDIPKNNKRDKDTISKTSEERFSNFKKYTPTCKILVFLHLACLLSYAVLAFLCRHLERAE